MPGFITHLAFGQQSISFIDNKEVQSLIESHLECFSLGLEGPDIFFYHLPAYLFYKKNIGNVMHNSKVMLFFDSLIDSRNSFDDEFDRKICDAYILGFIGHYTLDTTVHPYIYWRSNHFANLKIIKKYDFGKHTSLETDIDHILLEHYFHCLPSEFKYDEAVCPKKYQQNIIARLLFISITKIFPEYKIKLSLIRNAISSFIRLNKKMNDPKGTKKACLQSIENILFKTDFISSLIPSDSLVKYTDPCNKEHSTWYNPWLESESSNESIYGLLHRAMPVFITRILLYSECVSSDYDDNIISDTNKYLHNRNRFLSEISDLSYLNGLPL